MRLCLPVARGQEHHRVLLAAASPLWVGVEAVRSASVCSWGLGNFVLTIPNLTRCPLVAQKHPQCHSGLTKPSIHVDDGVNCPCFLFPRHPDQACRCSLAQLPPVVSCCPISPQGCCYFWWETLIFFAAFPQGRTVTAVSRDALGALLVCGVPDKGTTCRGPGWELCSEPRPARDGATTTLQAPALWVASEWPGQGLHCSLPQIFSLF